MLDGWGFRWVSTAEPNPTTSIQRNPFIWIRSTRFAR